MRLLIVGLITVLLAGPAAARQVTDSAGRKVEVPDKIERVFAAGPPAAVLLYVLAPDRMIGWPRAPTPEDLPYIAAEYRGLPEVGGLTGRGDQINLEALRTSKPDLVLDFGSPREPYVALADRVQEQTGIPYILIDGRLEHTAAALRLLGGVLGVEQRAESLAAYAENTFADIGAILDLVPDGDRPRVYLARGAQGLETGLAGSINSEILERAGAVNVAKDSSAARRGIVQVSLDQVTGWNPDTIVTWDRTFYVSVWSDTAWQGVEAIRYGQVYLSPVAPFGWVDRPPSINRLMGLQWLASVFYPQQAPQDLSGVTRDFYQLFYQVDLDEQDLDRLLASAKSGPR